MVFPRIGVRSKVEKVVLLVVVVAVVLLSLHFFDYDDSHFHRIVNSFSATKQSTSGFLDASYVLFPANYELNQTALRTHLTNTSSSDWKIIQVRKADVKPIAPFIEEEYIPHQDFSLYHSTALEANECDALVNLTVDSLTVSKRTKIPADFRHILELIVHEHDKYKDPYYKDIAPLIMKHVREELKMDFIDPFWFRLSGSSVWLKDHNVHFVISRFIFTDKLTKNDPLLSLTLGQIFDEHWNELRDVRLVFPTNDVADETAPVFRSGAQSFSLYRFPRILPIPFHHDYGKEGGKLFGPEDPRLMLVTNPGGYEEPLIVFNAQHYRMEKEDGKEELQKVSYRSMFFTLPFQFQKAKGVDVEVNKKAEKKWFTKTSLIDVQNMKKEKKNKNWTPMVSASNSLTFDDYDDSILFVTQLDNLKVVRCSLYSDANTCYEIYNTDGNVGDLRGGTQFININSLISQQHPDLVSKIFPPGRELYIGIARAHLSLCGCGSAFYRPNIVAITKDQASYYDHEAEEDRTKFFYRVSHVSSSLSLEVTMDPWNPDDPKSICLSVNALIPNGIGGWKIDTLKQVGDKWEVDDTLSLAISVADNTVDRVYLKGVLDAVFNSYDHSTVFAPQGAEKGQVIDVPFLAKDGKLKSDLQGFNNDNIHCAMRTSKDFCAAYGKEQKELTEHLSVADTSKLKDEFKKTFDEFKKALEKVKQESMQGLR